MTKLKIFSIVNSDFKKSTSNKAEGFDLMFNSVLEKKLPFQLVINNGRYDGSYYSKLLPIINFLESCNDDELILYVDAFDTIFLDNEEDIIRKFKLTNVKFLVSGEIFCYPFDTLQDEILQKTKRFLNDGIYKIEPENNYLFRHPCAGMMMGYKPYFLIKMYKWKEILEKNEFPVSNMVPKEIYSKSDQGACTIDYVKSENDFMKLDMYPRVFINHMCMDNNIFYLNNGKVEYQRVLNPKQEFPSIIHFNGESFCSLFDFSVGMDLSKNKVEILDTNKILKLKVNKKLNKPITFKIYGKNGELDYENVVNNNDCEVITISSKCISLNEMTRIEIIYQRYTVFKKEF
jgi:hypothetical protein